MEQKLVYIFRENYASFHLDEEVSVYSQKAANAEQRTWDTKTASNQRYISLGSFPWEYMRHSLVLQLFSLIEFSRFLNLSHYDFPLYGRNITFKEFA